MQSLVIDSRFFFILLEIDRAIAEKTREKGCPSCGGKLHVGNYPRKPRGLSGTDGEVHRRLSFCCSQCGKRVTPESVRFLGRKVYVGAVVILAMSGEWLKGAALKVCRQTLGRWRLFWNSVLEWRRSFWKMSQGFLPPGFQTNGTPIPIVEFFQKRLGNERWFTDCLSFFSPLSTAIPCG